MKYRTAKEVQIANWKYGMRLKQTNPKLNICYKCGADNPLGWNFCKQCAAFIKQKGDIK